MHGGVYAQTIPQGNNEMSKHEQTCPLHPNQMTALTELRESKK